MQATFVQRSGVGLQHEIVPVQVNGADEMHVGFFREYGRGCFCIAGDKGGIARQFHATMDVNLTFKVVDVENPIRDPQRVAMQMYTGIADVADGESQGPDGQIRQIIDHQQIRAKRIAKPQVFSILRHTVWIPIGRVAPEPEVGATRPRPIPRGGAGRQSQTAERGYKQPAQESNEVRLHNVCGYGLCCR